MGNPASLVVLSQRCLLFLSVAFGVPFQLTEFAMFAEERKRIK